MAPGNSGKLPWLLLCYTLLVGAMEDYMSQFEMQNTHSQPNENSFLDYISSWPGENGETQYQQWKKRGHDQPQYTKAFMADRPNWRPSTSIRSRKTKIRGTSSVSHRPRNSPRSYLPMVPVAKFINEPSKRFLETTYGGTDQFLNRYPWLKNWLSTFAAHGADDDYTYQSKVKRAHNHFNEKKSYGHSEAELPNKLNGKRASMRGNAGDNAEHGFELGRVLSEMKSFLRNSNDMSAGRFLKRTEETGGESE